MCHVGTPVAWGTNGGGRQLLHFPDDVGLEEFGKVVILLLSLDFLNLCCYAVVVCRSLYVTDDAESDWESVVSVHHGEFQLEGVVLAVCVVNEY